MFGGFDSVPDFLSVWGKSKNIRFPVDWKTLNLLLISRGITRSNRYDFVAPLFALDLLGKTLWHSLLLSNKNCCLSTLYDGQNIVEASYLRREGRKVDYTSWFAIAAMAALLGVPPELLVDDEAYYATDSRVRNARGMRFYKIVFECWKQGVSPARIYYPASLYVLMKDGVDITDQVKVEQGISYLTTYIYYIGAADEDGDHHTPYLDFTLNRVCALLGIAPQDMYMVRDKGYKSALSLISDMLPRLTSEDMLVLYGLTTLLTTPIIRNDKDALVRGVVDILNKRDEWGAQIDEQRRNKRRSVT